MIHSTSRRALVSVAAVFFVNGAVYGSWAPRLPEIRDRVGLSLAELGLVLSGAAVLALVGTVVAGVVVDRVGSREATAGAGLVVVIALAAIGFARSPLALVAALALVSAGDVVQDVAMNVQAARVSDARTRPVMSRLHGLWSLGTVVGGLAAARMAATDFSLTTHLVVAAAALGATTVIAVPGLLPSRRLPPGERQPGRPRGGGRAGAALVLLGFVAIAIELIPADWSALRLVGDLDTRPAIAGLAFGAFSTGMLVGRMAGDELVSRVGARSAVAGGAMVAAAGIAAGMLAPHVAVSIAGFAVAGLGVAPVFPQIYAEAANTPGLGAGVGIGLMTTGQRIGALLFPIVVGVLADTDALAVGQAAVLVSLPCAVALLVLVRRPTVSRD